MFSEEQKAIINDVDGYCIVIACPGSGKTTTMLERINYMVTQLNVNPNEILMVTFTKNAALEMAEKFATKYPDFAGQICFSTIHSMAYGILRKKFGIGENNIIKEWEKQKLFKQKLKNSGVDEMYLVDAAKKIGSTISFYINKDLKIEKINPLIAIPGKREEVELLSFYNAYMKYKTDNNKIDFDDMIVMCRDLLKKDPLLLNECQNRYKYYIIDEFQDTNKIQAQIFYMLSEKYGNLCVVGDDDQSIYGFRAAEPGIMLNFKKKFKKAKKYSLSRNYRCGKKIVSHAAGLISNNDNRYLKKFEAGVEEEGILEVNKCQNDFEENEKIINWIRLLNSNGEEFNNISVLARTNKELLLLMSNCRRNNIPVCVNEKLLNFYSHTSFRAIKAYYELSQNYDGNEILPGHSEAFGTVLNVPKRYLSKELFRDCNLSPSSIKSCAYKAARANKKPFMVNNYIDELICFKYLIEDLKKRTTPKQFLKRLVNENFKNWLKETAMFKQQNPDDELAILDLILADSEGFETMDEWMRYADSFEDFSESCSSNKDGVCLYTFHGSKGLEWNSVWIKGVSHKNLPHIVDDDMSAEEFKQAMEEERRMFYVAVTRAKNELQLSYLVSDLPSIYLKEMHL